MTVEITFNNKEKGIELFFDESLPSGLSTQLLRSGFKQTRRDKLKWYTEQHPSFIAYAIKLKNCIEESKDFSTLQLQPSFLPTRENITNEKFSLVTISYKKEGQITQQDHVLFDSRKVVATQIAELFAREKYGEFLVEIKVFPRNYKGKAREAFEKENVIFPEKHVKDEELELLPREKLIEENKQELYNEQFQKLKQDFKKEGRVFFKLEDQNQFKFTEYLQQEEIAHGETSQTGNDIVIYNTAIWDENLKHRRKTREKEDLQPPTPENQIDTEERNDYIDQVIANLHDQYIEGKRPTKGYIQKLASKLQVPNMGMMWEATELSWLLWYKQIYSEPLSFERRLEKMIHFWDKLQPTYAYSDSSKEIYKQYSTPCPIGAIIAEYTKMDSAQTIFEPSAGNGLLLVGADPQKVHANEIDRTRFDSLRYQNFEKITAYNASEPFPEEMTQNFDVVVTNPPFAKWEENKMDKERIVKKYFHNQIGVAKYIRLEHLMSGLALHTMKDTGKAGIIIMGHVSFGHDGLLAKYRPFFNWLYRHYHVDDIINMNSYKLYNKQGAVERTMLILINGRKPVPRGVAPKQNESPHLEEIVGSFTQLWERVKSHIEYNLDTLTRQLKIELSK